MSSSGSTKSLCWVDPHTGKSNSGNLGERNISKYHIYVVATHFAIYLVIDRVQHPRSWMEINNLNLRWARGRGVAPNM